MKHVLGILRVFKIPKLFFIDANRGLQTQTPISKTAIEDEGNYRIDYSTIPDHVACSGGVNSYTLIQICMYEIYDIYDDILYA